jgi:hypothetical protein
MSLPDEPGTSMNDQRVPRDGPPGQGGHRTGDLNVNDVVAFFVELAVVVLLAVAGFTFDGPPAVAVLLGVGLPVVAVALWGTFAAPRARVGRPALRLLVKVVVLGAGVVAGFVVLPVLWATVFAVVVLVNLVLMYVGPLARRPPGAGAATRR